MGYVAVFKKQDYSTPAAIVITETVVDVLIFPFVDTAEERLLIAAHVSLESKCEHNCLVLLAYLAYADLRLDYTRLKTMRRCGGLRFQLIPLHCNSN